jgi:hypothetical protein
MDGWMDGWVGGWGLDEGFYDGFGWFEGGRRGEWDELLKGEEMRR